MVGQARIELDPQVRDAPAFLPALDPSGERVVERVWGVVAEMRFESLSDGRVFGESLEEGAAVPTLSGGSAEHGVVDGLGEGFSPIEDGGVEGSQREAGWEGRDAGELMEAGGDREMEGVKIETRVGVGGCNLLEEDAQG